MKDTIYVTTAIPYANAKPHIGNAMDYVLADIYARYHRQHGKQVVFQVGTDEHGNKIAAKAKENNLEPKAYVDQTHQAFKILMDRLGVSYTNFVRTTDAHHVGASQYIWKQLEPYIYKSTYTGWYSQGSESFVTDAEAAATNGISPDNNQPYERIEEENYYLKASEFSDKIKEAIESGKMKIVPEKRKNEFLNLIKDGMQDVSISRPIKSLSWGITVPGDPNHVMYVWVDALSNYLTTIGYPDDLGWQKTWPADVQVVGKDILRFHAGIWPAMLLGLGLPLPKQILVHGHVTMDGKKMSKSIGNVVDPNEIIDKFGVDAFRYYFARHIPTQDDGDFTWDAFEKAYNSELGNDFGNLVQRVASMVNKYLAGVLGEVKDTTHDESLYIEAMEHLEFDKALDEVWVNIRGVNKYIDTVKPWEIAKKIADDKDAKLHLAEVLNYAVGEILDIADMITPFMPTTAEKIHNIFKDGIVTLPAEPLFPKIYLEKPEDNNQQK